MTKSISFSVHNRKSQADTSRIPEPSNIPLSSSAKNALSGLAGKNPWDAMCGKAGDGVSQTDLESARKRYEVVLHKHIEMIFEDGKSDAAAGRPQKTAKNPIDVSTLRGVVNSWIPPQHASRIYKVGYEIDKATDADMNRLGSAISESCDVLFNQLTLKSKMDLLKTLDRPSSDVNSQEYKRRINRRIINTSPRPDELNFLRFEQQFLDT